MFPIDTDCAAHWARGYLESVFYLHRFLPKDMKNKKTKTILCVRNPKDTAVSFFNHMTGLSIYGYPEGQWENWVGPYVQGKRKCNSLQLLKRDHT